ncbi:hypothetical protein Indivirus_1_88 [Indivirus ILV1]|uniref:Uncharacterized protein n=1 Tax=Indivirus ILV1 TaxID=1977633 RepID=A0A1V0SCN2_9VIRU|nr:hypothetical protein Indivirus_1_88 [Indivirus ILV1]
MNSQFTGSNRLVSNYNNSQQYNPSFQNNNLLMNNPSTLQQMQQIQKMKEMQQMKQLEKLNEVELTMDKEKIKESIIRPIKIEKNKQEKQELEKKWKESENNYRDKTGRDYGPEIKQYWSKRTNQPYKNIMKNEDYTKKISSDKDLIVHRVTNKDKEGVEEGFVDLQHKLEKHDDELKVIYSVSKKNEHKKKFEYNHVYKYRIQHDAKDHDELKEDKIKYYKDQQKKEEIGKKKLDVLLDTLVSDGIFNKDEITGLSLDKNKYNDTSNIKLVDNGTTNKKDKYIERRK